MVLNDIDIIIVIIEILFADGHTYDTNNEVSSSYSSTAVLINQYSNCKHWIDWLLCHTKLIVTFLFQSFKNDVGR